MLRIKSLLLATLLGLSWVTVEAHRTHATHASNHVVSNGWNFSYGISATDGLVITGASWSNKFVLSRMSVPQCRVDYADNNYDMNDQLGTQGNIPYVSGTTTRSTTADYVSIAAKFQCCNWPRSGSYRYDLRFIFYTNGRWRPMIYVYGPGIFTSGIYECHIRMDIDVYGAPNDYFWKHDIATWSQPVQEGNYRDDGTRDPGGSEWINFNWSPADFGAAYWIVPRTTDGRPNFVVLKYNAGQGNADLPAYSVPTTWDNNEGIQDADIVDWYWTLRSYTRPSGCPSQGASACTPVQLGPVLVPSIPF